MTISELIEALEDMMDQDGDLNVELPSGVLVSAVDLVYDERCGPSEPAAAVIK